MKLLAGSDFARKLAGIVPGESLLRELELLVQVGLTPKLALAAATTEPAKALGLEGETGCVRVGAHADLLLLAADPSLDVSALRRPLAVIRKGHVIGRERLEELRRTLIPRDH